MLLLLCHCITPTHKDQKKERSTTQTTTNIHPTAIDQRKMKVKALARSQASVQRECKGDLRKEQRNLDPKYHPLTRSREYTRAVTSAKMERMFAKPYVGTFEGHTDAVYHLCTSRRSLLPVISGAADGQIKLWDIPTRNCVATINAHTQAVKGLVFGLDNDFYSCGQDGCVKRYTISDVMNNNNNSVDDDNNNNNNMVNTWRIQGSFLSIDHQWNTSGGGSSSQHDRQFVTASDSAVQLWTPERSTPIQTHDDLWGSADTVNVVRFHPSEPQIVANCSMDRGIGLHDLRTASAMKKPYSG
jgi:DDB1- and CUL4-associated factor 13